MKIAVFGCGYVGLTTAVGFAELGNTVMAVDIDHAKIASLKKGVVPFYEPKMEPLLQRNITAKRLSFSVDGRAAILESEVIFCAVGTPAKLNGEVDLKAVYKVAELFAGQRFRIPKIFINKSTVPVGENQKILDFILKKCTFGPNNFKSGSGATNYFSYFYNPEFLREGSALDDFFKPDRIVVGIPTHVGSTSKVVLPQLGWTSKVMVTDFASAEMIKYASNNFLATKISFINEMADFCQKAGGNIQDVAKGIGLDHRIGPDFLRAGIGFGGSCLPKDLKAMITAGERQGLDLKLLKSVEKINNERPLKLIKELKKKLTTGEKKTPLKNKKITIWGASFKPNTDDLRESPALKIISVLLKQKAKIAIYDPAALPNLRKFLKDKTVAGQIIYCTDKYAALKNADALLVLTDWEEFRKPDMAKIKKTMANPLILIPHAQTKIKPFTG